MAGRAFRVCSVRKGYAGNSEMLATAFFPLLFLAISCCWLSGWDSVCIQVLGGCPTSNLSWQKTFPKRKAFVVVESDRWGSLYTGSFVSGFRSMGIVRSITGGLKNSPLSEGVSYLLSLGLGIMAIIYGYSIDLYRTDRDIIKGMSYSFVRFSGYCVTLFFVIQLFTSLHYTGLDSFFGLSSDGFTILYALCSILPLFVGGNKLK